MSKQGYAIAWKYSSQVIAWRAANELDVPVCCDAPRLPMLLERIRWVDRINCFPFSGLIFHKIATRLVA